MTSTKPPTATLIIFTTIIFYLSLKILPKFEWKFACARSAQNFSKICLPEGGQREDLWVCKISTHVTRSRSRSHTARHTQLNFRPTAYMSVHSSLYMGGSFLRILFLGILVERSANLAAVVRCPRHTYRAVCRQISMSYISKPQANIAMRYDITVPKSQANIDTTWKRCVTVA